jgi:hypothetical protein
VCAPDGGPPVSAVLGTVATDRLEPVGLLPADPPVPTAEALAG